MKPLVEKRDGKHVEFNAQFIRNAVAKACASVGNKEADLPDKVTEAVLKRLKSAYPEAEVLAINAIQSAVEDTLMALGHFTIARSYIEYRHDRDVNRERKSLVYKEIYGLLELRDKDILHENANKDSAKIPTQRDLLAGIVARDYAKKFILPKEVVEAHEKGEIHYHDLDYSPLFPMFNCMLVDLKFMLAHGFKMGNAEIEMPKSINTATAVAAQIIAQVASHTYGGTTLNRLDEVLAPYVLLTQQKNLKLAREWGVPEDKLGALAWHKTEKDTYDAFQSLEYEINTLHTSNGQTPFVTIGFGLGTSRAARLIQRSILQNRIDGLGKRHKTAVFPKLVFAIKDGINHQPSDPNYDIKQLALKCASKRMYPDILNYERVVEATGSFKTPMGCRSFLPPYEENGQLIHDGRNNLGVVSINLPRIALQSQGAEARFYRILDERLAIARKALDTRIARLNGVKAKVAPILYMEGALGVRLKAEDEVADLFKNGRATISLGYIGVYEALIALYGNRVHPLDSAELQTKGVKIVAKLRAAVDAWKAETGYGFSLYATPSENLCNRFAKLDRAEFGVIKDVTDKGYYTNSFHLDVRKACNIWDKIDFEKHYPPLSSGGFICYGEFPNMQRNIEGLETAWDYAYDNVPYYGTNTPIDECYECGYEGEFKCTSKGFVCPKCGNHNSQTVSVTRRVCGYLGSPDARPFNDGKQAEVMARVKHLKGQGEL